MPDPQIAGEFTAALRLHYGPGPHPDGSPQSVHAGGQPKAPAADTPRRRKAGPAVFDADRNVYTYRGDDGRERVLPSLPDLLAARYAYETTLAEARAAAFDSIYERTQAHLWRVGQLDPDDTIVVYRGLQRAEPLPLAADGRPTIHRRPLLSFSLRPGVAGEFSSMRNTGHAYTLAYRVPRKAIFAHWATGFGCAQEDEVVVLGDYLAHAPGAVVEYHHTSAGEIIWQSP